MKRTQFAGLILLAGLLGPASAALPPQYQRAAELTAVIQVGSNAMDEIDRVEYLSPDLYRVTSGRCHMDVRIVSSKSKGEVVPGPRQFTAEPGEVICQ